MSEFFVLDGRWLARKILVSGVARDSLLGQGKGLLTSEGHF
jgi:hypothetical protein